MYILTTNAVIYLKTIVNKKLVSAPQRVHMGMRAGGYFIIISHYFMTSLNLVNIHNCYTKIQNTMVIA